MVSFFSRMRLVVNRTLVRFLRVIKGVTLVQSALRLPLIAPVKERAYRWISRSFVNGRLERIPFSGGTLIVDPRDPWIGRLLYLTGAYEPQSFRFMDKIDLEGKTAIDVGANIGMFTVRLSQLVGGKGKVFAFEPSPSVYRILQGNIRENRLQNVTAVQAAVGACEGTAGFYVNPENSGDSCLVSEANDRASVLVRTTSLDGYLLDLPNHMNVGFIKIDIQGAELMALRGMTCLLEKNQEVILYLEYEPSSLIKMGFSPEDLFLFLQGHAFKIYVHMHEDRDYLSQIQAPDEIHSLPRFKLNPSCNIACTRIPAALGRNLVI